MVIQLQPKWSSTHEECWSAAAQVGKWTQKLVSADSDGQSNAIRRLYGHNSREIHQFLGLVRIIFSSEMTEIQHCKKDLVQEFEEWGFLLTLTFPCCNMSPFCCNAATAVLLPQSIQVVLFCTSVLGEVKAQMWQSNQKQPPSTRWIELQSLAVWICIDTCTYLWMCMNMRMNIRMYTCISYNIKKITYILISADPGPRHGRGGAWNHLWCGLWLSRRFVCIPSIAIARRGKLHLYLC